MLRFFWRNFLLIVLMTALAVVGYQTFLRPKPCAVPIHFSVGQLDPRFGVSQSQFVDDITKAGEIWSKAEGKSLFVYDPGGSLVVNLVYDTRQQTTQKEKALTTSINETKLSADQAKAQYQSLLAQYQSVNQEYTQELASLKAAQDSYNSQVEYWNARGGAPKAQYSALQAQKASLDAQLQSVEAKRQEVNSLADQANALIDQYNLLVDHINSNVRAINSDGLAGTQFEEGVYVSSVTGQHIDIYQFDNQTTFVRVLAHELGHALGLEHNSEAGSIMNPVNTGANLSLSTADQEELQTLCGV